MAGQQRLQDLGWSFSTLARPETKEHFGLCKRHGQDPWVLKGFGPALDCAISAKGDSRISEPTSVEIDFALLSALPPIFSHLGWPKRLEEAHSPGHQLAPTLLYRTALPMDSLLCRGPRQRGLLAACCPSGESQGGQGLPGGWGQRPALALPTSVESGEGVKMNFEAWRPFSGAGGYSKAFGGSLV